LGVALQNGGSSAVEYYPTVLSGLSQALGKESDRRVLDNIISAVCRLILANRQAIPLKQVDTPINFTVV